MTGPLLLRDRDYSPVVPEMWTRGSVSKTEINWASARKGSKFKLALTVTWRGDCISTGASMDPNSRGVLIALIIVMVVFATGLGAYYYFSPGSLYSH